MISTTLACPAKINLGLHILGKRPDGYHELDSIMLRLDGLADSVSVRLVDDAAAPPIQLTLAQQAGTEVLPSNEKNLVYQAAQLYLAHCPRATKVHIHLEKRIPIAAGLGGGSSDAASTLKALAQLLPGAIDLPALALQLGSDVPFFLLQARAARMRGRGEVLEPIALPLDGWHILLVNPRIAVSAGEAYGLLEAFDTALPLEAIARALAEKKPLPLHNGLQRGVLQRYPAIGELIHHLQQDCATVLMSGSGSTCFALSPAAFTPESIPTAGADYWWKQMPLSSK